MQIPPTRELARIASVLHLLQEQQGALSELADIQALRTLDDMFQEALEDAVNRDVVVDDPVSVVRSDWLRLVEWSNQIQTALGNAIQLGYQLEAGPSASEGSKASKQKWKTKGWKPSREELESMRAALESAPEHLQEVLVKARSEVEATDWEKGRPYQELLEVADAMGWKEMPELVEPPGEWARGISPRELPFVASRLAVEESAPLVTDKVESLNLRLQRANQLLEKHAEHTACLNEVRNLISSGQVESARQKIGELSPEFSDLDYEGGERELSNREFSLAKMGQRLESARVLLQQLADDSKGFFLVPPFGLSKRGKVALQQAQTVIAEASALEKEGRNSEWDQQLQTWISELKTTVQSFRSTSMRRLRQRVFLLTGVWCMFFISGSAALVKWQVRQEHERRLVAEAKAAAEKIERQRLAAEAEAKAAAEKIERQRLAAEADEMATAEAEAAADLKKFFTKFDREMMLIPPGTFVMG
ncbi:hypothetical protein OAE97_04135, partial [Verrucomicrobia bacterium]|nr:hypothetical protein [Verrucomicrobiota bacterium]